MAFTTSQKLDIARIVGITPTLLAAHLTALGASLTSDVESAVAVELDRWTTAGVNFVRVHPKEANFGAEIDFSNEQADIRRNIAVLLELPLLSASAASGMGTIQVSS